MKYVVSACLAGCPSRYDGGSNPCLPVIRLVQAGLAVPICPEQLSGLPVPRPPCEQQGSRVISRNGDDVSAAFAHGAKAALEVALQHGCSAAILKARSPSCGIDAVYDGSFSKTLVPGQGVWARLLREAGLRLYSEECLPPDLEAYGHENCCGTRTQEEKAMPEKMSKSGLDVVWDLRLAEVAKNLIEHGFAVDIMPDMPAAVDHFAKTLLPALKPGSAVVGGSVTVARSGVYDILKNWPGLEFINPFEPGISPAENWERRRRGMVTDLLVTSSNAILRDGRLLNLDGSGNRVAAMHFGPHNVVLFVGRNKICEDLETARKHIKEFSAPANCIRLGKKTPCAATGSCTECKSPDRICSVWTLTERSFPVGRIRILLINENLGF